MTGEHAQAWRRTVAAVLALGIGSLLSNIATDADDQIVFGIRRALSLVLNSGTAWAGVSVLAGWLLRRAAPAALAGLGAGSGALIVHYALGEASGLMPPGSFGDNASWFVIAAVTGGPLGLVGAAARAHTGWGGLARLVVPVGAVLEPLLTGWWQGGAAQSTATHTSNLAAAVVLTAAGVVGAYVASARARSAYEVA